MSFDRVNARRFLQAFDFRNLFLESLGWDHYRATLPITVDGRSFPLQAVAEKRGVVALVCALPGELPPYATRRRLEREVNKAFREHILIFVDGRQSQQIWQWVRREPGRPLAGREITYDRQQSGERLLQRLETLAVSLDQEEGLTLVDVTGRLRAAFDVERATKKFYDHFRQERDAFHHFLQGIPDDGTDAPWYVSVMLNRLMFIYFIQKKGFLDNDPDYLRHKLQQSQQRGQDRFYRDFLCPLFFLGFALPDDDRRKIEARHLLGKVPYLNGGIFQQHEVEQRHGQAIAIPDAAFVRLFDFFDQYQWHLDDRPLRDDREINPDVLGYIFEKYINQKQMGAYYTKEDITGYISRNTIIPFLFDEAARGARVAFEPGGLVWSLPAADPDRYIYDAVGKGADLPLPPEIAAGIDDVSQRGLWNTRTPDDYGLPTEIWRETVARRQRYEEVKAKLAAGQIQAINDFITYNLDVEQFAQDVIENCEGADLLNAFWRALHRVAILDPTCGSGAFLFAALNILESLYEACLERMKAFADEPGWRKLHPIYSAAFDKVLQDVARHPNETYFIYKSIVVNNLYGVDIMAEAVEIAKLRLFLKLVSQVEPDQKLEPLPDIDFNIRAGNTLVGFTTKAEVEKAIRTTQTGQLRLTSAEDLDALQQIEEKAIDVDELFGKFRQMQTEGTAQEYSTQDYVETKEKLQERLAALEAELNRYLATQYGVNPDKAAEYQKWLDSHKPFHWFVEFYGILKQGGFDVIIGNPPYVEYHKIRKMYKVLDYITESCGNIYAFVCERSYKLLGSYGHLGLIVPLSIMSTERMSTLQRLVVKEPGATWMSAYDVYPMKLFEGAKQRLTILITSRHSTITNRLFTTTYNRWWPEERSTLFPTLMFFHSFHDSVLSVIPKLESKIEAKILEKLASKIPTPYLSSYITPSFYVHRIPYNFIKAVDFVPFFWNEVDGQKKSEDYKPYKVKDPENARVILAILNSNLFFWWWYALFEGYHCGKHEIESFPISIDEMRGPLKRKLAQLASELMEDYKSNAERREAHYKTTGKVIYEQFTPRSSKAIIDRIDAALAIHYGFTNEELDYIMNCNIKYRMGVELGEEEFSADPEGIFIGVALTG